MFCILQFQNHYISQGPTPLRLCLHVSWFIHFIIIDPLAPGGAKCGYLFCLGNFGQHWLTHWGRGENRRHFADDIFKCILLNENVLISIKISLKFIPKGPINNIPALVQIMAWCRPGDKPLSEPMVVSLLTHISVTRPQWVKGMACCLITPSHYLNFFSQDILSNIDLGSGLMPDGIEPLSKRMLTYPWGFDDIQMKFISTGNT